MRTFLISLALLAACSLPVAAAEQHNHDHSPKHGGILAEAHDIDFELVAKPDRLTLHVVAHDQPLSTAAAKAQATLYAGSGKSTVELLPAGGNTLTAQGQFKTGVGVRVVVTVQLPGKPEAKLNFKLK